MEFETTGATLGRINRFRIFEGKDVTVKVLQDLPF